MKRAWCLVFLLACASPELPDPPSQIDPLAPLPSAACGEAPSLAGGVSHERTLLHDEQTRSFRLRPPTSSDGETPQALMLVLHGGFGSGAQIEEQIDMNSLAEREGAVVAYPDGIAAFPDAANDLLRLRSWNGGECCGPAAEAQHDDAGFLVAAVQDIGASVCIDLRRVYVTGFSNGAIMSQRLLCEHPEVFAAAAPVSGTLSFPACDPGKPVPLMHIHGTEDPHVPFNGGEGCGPVSNDGFAFLSVEEEMSQWGAINECEGEPVPLFTEGDTVCETRGDCAEETILCRVNGGNHSWPSAPQSGLISVEGCEGGAQSTTFRANEQIWNFFAAHRLPL